MKLIRIYLDNNDSLVLSEFKNVDSEYESDILKGKQSYEYIRKISSKKIVEYYENKNKDLMIIDYKDCSIEIYEYSKTLEKRGMAPIVKSIQNFEQEKSLSKIKPKKVKRTNKHINKKILAGTLASIVLISCAISSHHNFKNIEFDPIEKYASNTEVTVDDATQLTNYNEEIVVDSKEENIEEVSNITEINISYEDRSSTDKAYITKAWYGDMITKYANMYGIDPSLAIAIATQERGIHSNTKDVGGATGLMQIQNSVWIGEELTAYNFNTKKYETVNVTLNKVSDVEQNIKIGCMILQNAFNYMKNNPLAAIQCYNMGYGNMMDILIVYSRNSGKNVDEILADVKDTNWMDYRKIIKEGDQEYVEHVLSWIGDNVELKNTKKDGNSVKVCVINNFNTKKIY